MQGRCIVDEAENVYDVKEPEHLGCVFNECQYEASSFYELQRHHAAHILFGSKSVSMLVRLQALDSRKESDNSSLIHLLYWNVIKLNYKTTHISLAETQYIISAHPKENMQSCYRRQVKKFRSNVTNETKKCVVIIALSLRIA